MRWITQGLIAFVCTSGVAAEIDYERIIDADSEPQNWLTYNGGYDSQRFSGLKQINQKNVASLKLQWVLQNQVFGAWQSNPIVVDGIMYITQRPNDIMALDPITGRVFWVYQHAPDPNSQVCCGANNRGVAVLGDRVFMGTLDGRLVAVDRINGKELWKIEYGGLGFSIVPKPVTGHGMIFMSTGFMKAKLLAVRYEKTAKPDIAWSYARSVSTQPSPLLVGDELYFITESGGLITCLNAHTGKPHWVERIGGNYSASPIYADGRLYFFSEEGKITVIAPGREFKKLAESKLTDGFMASPAVAGNALILRTKSAVYRVE